MARVTCVVLLSLVTIGQAVGIELSLQATPAFLYVGKWDGEIMRCVYDKPRECEAFGKAAFGLVSTIVHGEHLYAASGPGTIVRCSLYKKNSCAVFYKADPFVTVITTSIAVAGEYLVVGSSTGTLLRCNLHRVHNCMIVRKYGDPIISVYALNDNIIVAFDKLYIDYCSVGAILICTRLYVNSEVSSILKSGKIIVTAHLNSLSYYKLGPNDSIIPMNHEVSFHDIVADMKIFRRRIHMVLNKAIMISDENNDEKFQELVRHEDALRISFTYGFHHIQAQFNGRQCSRQPRPSAVFNYREEHRRAMEAIVVDGELRDSRGAAVDTRNADAGHSGRVAVFAMGPDGQLLLSTSHRSGLIHITSFFNGNPVSGAGEMIVEDGIIKEIIACSNYYLPDVKLNRQVVDALWSKGYTRADEIILLDCFCVTRSDIPEAT